MPSFTILEPMSTGDVIDRAVRLYRRNFTSLVAIIAVPTLISYVVSLMVWYGYTGLLNSASGNGPFRLSALWMLIFGAIGLPISAFVLLLAVSGTTRVVGDNIMLGEPITFRGCVKAARARFGAITLMSLLLALLTFVAYMILVVVVFIVVLSVALLAGVIAAARMPTWLSTTVLVVLVIVAVALALWVACAVFARLAFLPQSVMIEGESAVNALGRAIRLGKGNWYKVGAILLFTYFISLSLQWAFMLPVVAGLYLSGALTAEFFVSPWWSILYTSFGDITKLLSSPILIISITLLYFDSRVRKEAYDLDLLAREINPGFIWQPAAPADRFPSATFSTTKRSYVQTSPLGLAGIVPSRSDADFNEPSASTEEVSKVIEELEQLDTVDRESGEVKCGVCDAPLMPAARFCMNCGSEVNTEQKVGSDQIDPDAV